MKKKLSKIIEGEISWEKMDGDNELEKKVNCYLTKQFVYSRDIPADECLQEAKFIIAMVNFYMMERYLHHDD